ncbi:Site-specific recombinase XerC [Malonomonas rubra DSM 5091]|uniref:Site-specific recombinase XerC n=1 Tax=Malonomonas rubra DSM 5091 TaxID=1122189 RepID=A0A1M6JQ00_MALRU|nr:site-specific integrase [Malonomonas rubra]SHJ48785.1 Site-specific recombinase XerC [Malonomonas rubra DSM 5091]
MASILKRGQYQWQVRIRKKGWPTQTKTFETKEEAARWARKMESEMDDGLFVSRKEAETNTLEEVLDRYCEEVTPNKEGAEQERNRIKHLKKTGLAKRFMSRIRSTDIAKYRDKRLSDGLSPYTVNNELILLSNVFNIARKEFGFESIKNPVSDVSRPKLPGGRNRRLLPGEEEKLSRALDREMNTLFVLALETGVRRGELLRYRWEHIDLESRVIHLPKTKNGEARDIPLSTTAVSALKKLPRRIDGNVFSISKDDVSRKFRETCNALDIQDLRWHDLRHEALSRLFEKGLGIMEVASISGHKTLQQLKRYTHLKAKDLALKLG